MSGISAVHPMATTTHPGGRSLQHGHLPKEANPGIAGTDQRSAGGCCLCGKHISLTSKVPFPERWPQHLRVYATKSAHKTCLNRIRKIKTEYSTGFLHKKWDLNGGPAVITSDIPQPKKIRVKLLRPMDPARRKLFSATSP